MPASRSVAFFHWFIALALSGFASISARAEPQRFDILILNGQVVDGTGAPWYLADVGIRDGKIVEIGRLSQREADQVLDASGLIVAPGFIDMMGQTASPMVDDPKSAINLLTQGITTINAGEGHSSAPLSRADELRTGYTTMMEYFALLDSHGLPVNVAQTVGHTQIRRLVLGDAERRPSDDELKQMQSHVREAMQAGAIGLSTALIYPPAVYAPTEEIAALAKVAGEHGGRYYTHMRNEGDRLLEAIDEALEIGQQGETPVHIFHLKAAGQDNWGKMEQAISRIRSARARGQQVTADVYPYINNGLGISALIHPRHFSKGYSQFIERLDDADLRKEIRKEMETTTGWENWFRHCGHDWDRVIVGRSNVDRYREHDGLSVAKMAAAVNEDPWETFFQLVRGGAFALPQTMSQENKILAMQQNFVSFCTDVGPAGGSRSAYHPRAFGAFPRLLAKYVRELDAISLPRAVAQASAAAANNLMAYDRGRIAVGLAADVIVLDQNRIIDHADFKNPHARSEGVQAVIVNGRVVLQDGKYTGARPGRVLRGPGYDRDKAPYQVSAGPRPKGFANYDRSMREFMKEHRVPGASIAVSDRGRVVFARGYGYANLADGEQVTPESLFRIASVSKPITAVAILQLVDQGLIQLNDKVFDVLDFEEEIAAAGDQFDQRLRQISIRHLLQHRGGWDRDESFDAMFQSVRFAEQFDEPPPAKPATVIKAMLRQPLDFDPGTRYAYSNFGYCLLGRVIEKLCDQTYEDYVKEHVLAPLGITTMRIGATRLDGRVKNEVRYYQPGTGRSVFSQDLNQKVPWPYGAWYLEAMDAHGGWIASATDLVKFAAAFDDPHSCPILSEKYIAFMHARPEVAETDDARDDPPARYYSLGWNNRDLGDGQFNYWHGGSLNGTATIMIRRHDGKNFVALLNTRVSPTEKSIHGEIDRLLHKMANEVTAWPE